jgi:uncharacterized protein (TIGR00730 family)
MHPPVPRRVCVYCGSAPGNDPALCRVAADVGRTLAGAGVGVVYGGSQFGLMGALADGALGAGGEVIGVLPERLTSRERAHPRLSSLRIVATMHERKAAFTELSGAFLVLPGGIGTLDELFEAWTWRAIGVHDRPIAILNLGGYYDALLRFLDDARAAGLLHESASALVEVLPDADAVGRWVAEKLGPA